MRSRSGVARFIFSALVGFTVLTSPEAFAQANFALLSPSISLAFPPDSSIPPGFAGEAVRYGQVLFTNTKSKLPAHVGNGLTCSSCHLGGGGVAYAAPIIGIWGKYPEYRARSGKVISLAERIDDCFERSMNGKALAPESPEMKAMLAYIRWASSQTIKGGGVAGRGFGALQPHLVPDPIRGALLYLKHCSVCHGSVGAGQRGSDGVFVIPPVWGEDSFTVGAGMARTFTAAAFIRYNMPLGQVGVLSDQDAVDIAQFVTHQPRPEFAARRFDWPLGDAPSDARLN